MATEARETVDLISSDKVEGTAVYDAKGEHIGSIEFGPLPTSNTITLETGLKIVTGLTETLDQDAAMEVYREWPQGTPFPLKKQFALDKKALDFCREHYPEQIRKLDACIVAKPKKPSFSFKSE
jgi:hypothetical protein